MKTPLRQRLARAFFTIGLVPVLATLALFYSTSSHNTRILIDSSFQEITSGIVKNLGSLLEARKNNLIFLTSLLIVREKVVENVDKDGLLADLLLSFRNQNPEFDEVIVLKNNGGGLKPFASTHPKRVGTELSEAEKKLFGAFVTDKSEHLHWPHKKQFLSSPWTGKHTIPLGVPFKGEDEEMHLLVGLLDLEKIQSHLRSINILGKEQSPDQFLVVFDHDGQPIFHPPFYDDQFLLSNFPGTRSNDSKDNTLTWKGTTYLSRFQPGTIFGWQILVMQNSQIAYLWINTLAFQVLGIIFISILGVTFFSRTIAANLGTPISRLADGAKELASGHFDFPLESSDFLEIDEMTTSFREMVSAVKSAQEKLGFLNQNLERKVEIRTEEIGRKNAELTVLSNQLSKYLSPQLYNSIFSGKQEVIIGSRRRKLAIFFSDIRNFTTISEELESEELTRVLNEYLDEMARIALEFGGTIDKYIGDAIMIFFGDPETQGEKDDTLACVSMAIKMQKRMESLRISWKKKGWKNPFHIRCGIHSGFCTVGNFGSQNRLDYTIIGRSVNLASRLESNAAPDKILISESCYLQIQDRIDCLSKGEIPVKGFSKPVAVYEVIGEKVTREEPLRILETGEGFSIDLRLDLIPPEEKRRIGQKLQEAATQLTSGE